MSQIAPEAAQIEIDQFKSEVESARQTHAALIAELEAELLGVSFEYSETYIEFTDELSGSLGANAANNCEDADDQETAIGRCESYFSNEVANDPMTLVAACVAIHGPEKAREVVGSMVSESPLQTGVELGR